MLSIINEEMEKKKVQAQVIQFLENHNYSLNVVNRYKENIIHVSATNNCIDILQSILKKHDKSCLERKNSFGWTPLMQAIRNENIEMVKFLLSCGVNVNDFSFLGLSVLTLACAISTDMFDLLYNNCPSALEYAAHDDINPLCVAALKNDKELFFKLISLGLSVQKANAFTQTMMRQSSVPEIAAFAKLHSIVEDYWTNLSDIEDQLTDLEINHELNEKCNSDNVPKISVEHIVTDQPKKTANNKANLYLNLKTVEINNEVNNLISPTLSYVNKSKLPISPNTFIREDNLIDLFMKVELDVDGKTNTEENCEAIQEDSSITLPVVLQRCQNKRPPNLKLRSSSNDSSTTLSFTPQFTPTRTPNLPNDINEDNVFDETTPTPPKYKTPPRGIIIDPNSTKLMMLLQRFGLRRHIPIFLEQEVDLDLFLTLTDKDLLEIGIEKKSERLIILSVINECKGLRT